MQNYSEMIKLCQDKEKEAAIKAMARGVIILTRMAPVYQEGAVDIFPEIAVDFCEKLKQVTTMDEFDDFHKEFMEDVRSGIKSRREPPLSLLSHGEAQKCINVLLKTYVDRSNLPDTQTATRLKPFLHVPLDSVMIGYFKTSFESDYVSYISPAHARENAQFGAMNPGSSGKIPDRTLSKLAYIYEDVYVAWQKWFRAIYPAKPILLDTIWALER